jgi:hypothetical protein
MPDRNPTPGNEVHKSITLLYSYKGPLKHHIIIIIFNSLFVECLI